MTEIEKMKYAKLYLDKLANGINPLDDAQLPENDIVNNVRITRCLYYISDILQQVIENHGVIGKRADMRLPFRLSAQEKATYIPSAEPKSVSQIAKDISACCNTDLCRPLNYIRIVEYMVKIGALEPISDGEGKTRKKVTEIGNRIGLFEEFRQNSQRNYFAVMYNTQAQKYIIDHLDEVLKEN